MKSAVQVDTNTVADIEFQPASLDIWDAKYRLAAKDGTKLDESIDEVEAAKSNVPKRQNVLIKQLTSAETDSDFHHFNPVMK